MKKTILLLISHLVVGVAGFAAGVYYLPILTAPPAPSEAEVAAVAKMAAYTGERIEWSQAQESKEDFAPDNLKWEDSFEPHPMPEPGVTKEIMMG